MVIHAHYEWVHICAHLANLYGFCRLHKKTTDMMEWNTMHMFCRLLSVFLLRTLTFCFFHGCCATIHLARSTMFLHKVTMDSMPLVDWVRLSLMLLLLLLLQGGLQKKWLLPLFMLLRNSANQWPFPADTSEKVAGYLGLQSKEGYFKNSVGKVESHWLVDGCRAASQ